MPLRHSSPAQPRSTLARTSSSHGSPAAAVSSATPLASRVVMPRRAIWMTRPVDAPVGDDEVGAAAQHAQRQAALARPRVRVEHGGLVRRAHEPARDAADAERREGRQRHALADGTHGISRVARHGPPAQPSPAAASVALQRARSCTRAGLPDPQLHALGPDAVAAPPRRARHLARALGFLGHAGEQLGPRAERLALPAGDGGHARLERARRPVAVGVRVGRVRHRPLDPHLALDPVPVKDQRRARAGARGRAPLSLSRSV